MATGKSECVVVDPPSPVLDPVSLNNPCKQQIHETEKNKIEEEKISKGIFIFNNLY